MKRLLYPLTLIGVAIAGAGCPPRYEVVTGNWVLFFPSESEGIGYGLTLNDDASAIPYVATVDEGKLPGIWTWASDGVYIRFYQYLPDLQKNWIYSARLTSATSAAAGSWHIAGEQEVIGEFECRLR